MFRILFGLRLGFRSLCMFSKPAINATPKAVITKPIT